jgi:hypothetical protein
MFFIVLDDAIGADVQVTNFALVNVSGAEFGAALDAVGDSGVGTGVGGVSGLNPHLLSTGHGSLLLAPHLRAENGKWHDVFN